MVRKVEQIFLPAKNNACTSTIFEQLRYYYVIPATEPGSRLNRNLYFLAGSRIKSGMTSLDCRVLRTQILFLMAFLLTSVAALSAAEVRLELKNVELIKRPDGKEVAVVGRNQQFDIDIIITGAQKRSEKIAIPGLDAVHVIQQGQSSSTQMVNGIATSETMYHVTVQPKTEGAFTLGPAQIELDGKIVSSNNSFLIDARKNVPSSGKQDGAHTGQLSVFCKISVDKQRIVVGEPVTLTLSVYKRGQVLEMSLENPSFEGFLVKEQQGKIERTEVVDGISYQVQEIKYTLTPLSDGVKEIKPLSIQYLVQGQKRRTGLPGHFGFGGAIEAFFGHQPEQKLASSNDLNVTVLPLPEHKGQVHGIGEFSAFKASLSKNVADLNEPITLTLSIEGNGNFDQIPVPNLTLPKWFKSYDSKSETNVNAQGGKKQFDFIVQATKAGSLQIPPQVFTFFDVKSQSYKTLKTSPMSLEITVPDDYQQASVPVEQKPDDAVKTQQTPHQTDMLGSVQSLVKAQTGSLPWWLFVIFLVLPVLIFRKKIQRMISSVITKLFGARIHRRDLERFDKELDALQQKRDARYLHPIFIRFLATKHHTSVDVITEDWIEQMLAQSGWLPEKIEEFLAFLSACAQLNFMQSKSSEIDQIALLKRSKYWLIMLNK